MSLSKKARALKDRIDYVRNNVLPYWRESERRMPGMGAIQRAGHMLRGYDPLEASWYAQVRPSRPTLGCISTFQRETSLGRLNGPHAYLLNDKLIFAHLMRSAGLPHSDLFAFTHHGMWEWIDDGRTKALARLECGEAVVVKPISGRKGQSIEFIRSPEALTATPARNVIATSFVRQADYAARIHPGSLNTIRILSVTGRDGSPVIAAAVHRFGSSSTGGVDNFSAGGIVARVDLTSGLLDRAARIGEGNRLLWSDRHPETDERIAGVEVPHWAAVEALVLRLCATFPFLRYVGWDIAITDDGPVVIEGNARPSLRFFQLYEPMLDDLRVRGFFLQALNRGR